MKDYYIILGILPDAEDVVIRAAYKALVQRYHPDRFKGDPVEAHRKTAELNEAYEILSNPQKRAQYDTQRKTSQNSTNEYNEDNSNDYSSSDIDKDWDLAIQFYPDLNQIESRLRKISTPLSIGFRYAMLSTQEFDHRHELAKALELRFLENYFGSNPEVIDFARKLIFDGKKDGAKELNRAINVLGFKSDPGPIIRKLTEKYYKKELDEEREKQEEKARIDSHRKSAFRALEEREERKERSRAQQLSEEQRIKESAQSGVFWWVFIFIGIVVIVLALN